MTERTYQDVQAERMRAEIEAFEGDPRAKHQAILDRWWASERALEDELNDYYTVGGFQEQWSKTPSFTKGKRDRDWRVR